MKTFSGLGALVFTFALTTISNLKMSANGTLSKSGFFDIGLALFIAALASASIHRIAITICILFSGILLFFFNTISHSRYTLSTAAGVIKPSVDDKKRK